MVPGLAPACTAEEMICKAFLFFNQCYVIVQDKRLYDTKAMQFFLGKGERLKKQKNER